MTDETDLPNADFRTKLLAEVRTHPHAAKIASFCYDLLSGQARGKALIVGRDYASTRAEAHGLSREEAKTSFGNVREWMERGLKDDIEYALVSAFTVVGAKQAPNADWGSIRVAWDWLELNTGCSPYSFVEDLLPAANRDALWEAVRAAAEVLPENPKAHAHHAFHGAVLRDYGPSLTGAAERDLRLEGAGWRDERTTRGSSFRRMLLWCTGVAVILWLLRGAFWVLGGRHRSRVIVNAEGMRLRGEVVALGKLIRTRDSLIGWNAIGSVKLQRSLPFALSFAGVASFALGVLVGGVLVFDGVRSGETVLLMAGAGVALTGAGLDMLGDLLNGLMRGHGTLWIHLSYQRELKVFGVRNSEVEPFLDAVARFQRTGGPPTKPTKVYRNVDVGHSVP